MHQQFAEMRGEGGTVRLKVRTPCLGEGRDLDVPPGMAYNLKLFFCSRADTVLDEN